MATSIPTRTRATATTTRMTTTRSRSGSRRRHRRPVPGCCGAANRLFMASAPLDCRSAPNPRFASCRAGVILRDHSLPRRSASRARMPAYLVIDSLCVSYGATRVLDHVSLDVAARRDDRAPRQLGLRQDDAAALDRRLRPSGLRRHPRRRPGHHGSAAGKARHGDDVPVVRAVAAHERRGEHRLRARDARLEEGRDRRARRRDAEAACSSKASGRGR